MQKFGILTLYYKNDNYGGIAQAYALQKYIEKIGYDAKLICYQRTSSPILLGGSSRQNILGLIHRKLYNADKKIALKLLNKIAEIRYSSSITDNIRIRKEAFERSREIIPHSDIVYTDETIPDAIHEFDCFVSGSDQIWKPGVIRPPFVCSFLSENNKCFSYASSITVKNLSEEYGNFMKRELMKYQWVSVREEYAKNYLQKLLGRNVDVVLDPTLLLDRSDWEKLTSERKIQDSYILVYLLGQSREQRKSIKRYAKMLNLRVVFLPHVEGKIRACDIGFGDIELYDIDVSDFFSLIKNAEMIFTDSFHAVVFSVIFQKKFWVFDRQVLQLNGEMGSRIDTLLAYTKLEHRKIQDLAMSDSLNDDIDFASVYKRLKPEIKRSRSLLVRAIQKCCR